MSKSQSPSKQPFAAAPGVLLAIDPKAFGLEFLCAPEAPKADTNDPNMTIVCVDGPLHYASLWFATYDGIRAQVREACEASAEVICLRINSPGGDLHGAFDCARDLRAMADAAGKRLVVHVEAECCSAAYALACAAHEIVISSTGHAGSIGVICQFATMIEAARGAGVSFTLISSGAYKADGNEQAVIDEPMRERLQAHVDAAAGEFFALVAESRPLDAATVRALQAATFMGQAAVDQGLADRVASWSELRSQIAAGGYTVDDPRSGVDMPKKAENEQPEDEARAALSRKAESDDPVEAARAKRALAAYDEVPEDKEKDEGEESASASASAPAAAAPSAESEEDDSQALAAAAGNWAAQLQAANAKIAKLEARNAESDMTVLLASRPDVGADLKATLKTLPIAQAKAVLESIPRGDAPIDPAARTPRPTAAAPTGGHDLTNPETRKAVAGALSPAVQRAFGLGSQQLQPRMVGSRFFVDAPPAELEDLS